MRKVAAYLTICAVILTPAPSAAWGFEAHRFIFEKAIGLLPPEIRPFFERYRVAVVEHAIDPDLWRTVGWDAEEGPRHFLDMDAYGPHPFTELPRDYDAAVKRYGAEFVKKNGRGGRARSRPSWSKRSCSNSPIRATTSSYFRR